MRNTLIIFLVSGFWHGANWTFICWGGYHALLFFPILLIGKNRKHKDTVAQGRLLPSFKEVGQISITFICVLIGWILFRSESMTQFFEYMKGICTPSLFQISVDYGAKALPFIILLIVVEWFQREKQHALQMIDTGLLRFRAVRWSIYIVLIFIIIFFPGAQSDFIYFQF